MTENTQIKVFEEKQVRSVWDKEKEEWFFSVVDVVAILTDSKDPRNYWKVLKHRLNEEGSELVTNCNQLKMPLYDEQLNLNWGKICTPVGMTARNGIGLTEDSKASVLELDEESR